MKIKINYKAIYSSIIWILIGIAMILLFSYSYKMVK